MNSIKCEALLGYLDELLKPGMFKDYCPNGLQIQGKSTIQRLITGVTASQDFLDAAIEQKADAVLVHHGYFWKGEQPNITGTKYHRVRALIEAGVNLFAYHLPLDCHPEFGNNAQLGQRIGIQRLGHLTPGQPNDPGDIGCFDRPLTLSELEDRLIKDLGQKPLIIPGQSSLKPLDSAYKVEKVAWCTGGAQSYFERAIAQSVDVYITGEISEPMVHLARESGVTYVAAGHHATERYGALSLGNHLAEHFGLEVEFIDIDNPV